MAVAWVIIPPAQVVVDKDAAVLKGAQKIVAAVRQMDYAMDVLAVATALVKTHYYLED